MPSSRSESRVSRMLLVLVVALWIGFVHAVGPARAAARTGANADAKVIAGLRDIFGVRLLPTDVLTKESDKTLRVVTPRLAFGIEDQVKNLQLLIEKGAVANALLVADNLCSLDGDDLLPAAGGMLVPIRWLVQRYVDESISELPKDEVDADRVTAKHLSTAARAAADLRKRRALLDELVGRFLYRPEGITAVTELVDIHGGQGDYAAALHAWARALQVRRSFRIEEPTVLLRLALCFYATGQADRALALAQFAARHYPDAPVRLAGRTQKLGEAAAALTRVFKTPSGPEQLRDWPMFGGNAARSAIPGRDLARPLISWSVPEPSSQPAPPGPWLRREHVRTPAAYPMTAGRTVYFHSGTAVEARDWTTGLPMWSYSHGARPARPSPFVGCPLANPYGTMAVGNGLLVWVPRSTYGRPGSWSQIVGMKAVTNQTRAEVLWIRGGPSDQDPALRTASFAGGILLHGDRVYAPAYVAAGNKYALCCFDAGSGWLVWRTTVSVNRSLRATDAVAKMTGLTPVTDGSSIYCAVANGMAAAVDADSGRLRWLTYLAPRKTPPARVKSAPLLRAGHLLVTPGTASQLVAMNSLTGQVQWSVPMEPTTYVLGATDERAYLCDTDRKNPKVTCLALRTGKPLWGTKLDQRALRGGLLLKDRIWCPTIKGIEALNPVDGKRVGDKTPTFSWEGLGALDITRFTEVVNIVPSGPKFIIDTGHRAVAFYSRSFAEELQQESRQWPDDASAHVALARWKRLRGDLAGAANRYQSAVDSFRAESGSLQRSIQELTRQELSGLLEILADQRLAQNDAAGWEELIQKAIAARSDLSHAARLIHRLAWHYAGAGKGTAAIEQIQPLLAPARRDSLVDAEPGLRTRAALDAIHQMRELQQKANVVLGPEIEQQITKITAVLTEEKPARPLVLAWELTSLVRPVGRWSGQARVFFSAPDHGVLAASQGRLELRDALTGRVRWSHSVPCLGVMILPTLEVENVHPRLKTDGPRLRRGDKIVKVNGRPVSSPCDVTLICATVGAGKAVAVDFVREDKPMRTTVTLSDFHELYPEWATPGSAFRVNGGADVLARGVTDVCEVLDIATGQPKVAFAIGQPTERLLSLLVFDRKTAALLRTAKDSGVVAVNDIGTGKELGRFDVPFVARESGFFKVGESVVLFGRNEIASIDLNEPITEKALLWAETVKKNEPPVRGLAVAAGDRICLTKPGDRIEGWSLRPLKKVWEKQGLGQLMAASNGLIITATPRQLTALNPSDGTAVWTRPLRSIPAAVAVGKEAVFVRESRTGNTVQALWRDTGKALWTRPVGPVTWLAEVGGMLFAAPGAQSALHGLDSATGETWLTVPYAPADIVPVGSSGYCITTERWSRTYLPKPE